MAKTKTESAGLKIDLTSIEIRKRIPMMYTDAYVLKLQDAEEGVAEGNVINNIDVTGFAVIVPVNVTSLNTLSDGKTLRVNGDIDIDLSIPEDEVGIFDKLYIDKSEAIQDWKTFMEEKVTNAEKIRESYNNLVGFLRNQLKEEMY
ncbi:MAG: hypothetical protein AB7V50_11250 [Vampirovibrionia bacterium]